MVIEQQSQDDPFKKQSNEKRLVVVDGNHLIHRAFYAIQAPLKTSKGEPTNAIYGFAGMLINIIEAEKPDYIAMAFDEKAPTFRHKAHDEYKGTRKKAPDELYAQIPHIRELVKRFNIPIYAQEGFEADDLMGTLAVKARSEGITSYLVTGDMDLLQLVNGQVHVVFPHKGYREPFVYDGEGVKKKYGITADQVVDYKAIVGDTSDNIKGVDGIGPKGAERLLNQYKTLDGIYEHIDEIEGGMHDKLVRDKEQAYFARHLSEIVTDIPIDFNLDDLSLGALDYKACEAFLHEMEIMNLDRRLKRITPAEKLVSEEQMSLF